MQYVKQLIALKGEIYKGLLFINNRKVSNFLFITQVFLLFIGFMFFIGYGKLDPKKIATALIGYLVLYYVDMLIVQTGWNFMKESQSGTIEQLFMSTAPANLVVLGGTIAIFIAQTILLIPIIIAILITLYLLSVPLPIIYNPIQGLIVLLITFVGLLGFVYIIISGIMLYKNIEGAVGILRRFLMFFNGSILPISHLPNWLATFAIILPTTQGIIVLRSIILDGKSLGATLNDGSLLMLCTHSILYLVIGLLIFRATEKKVKREGTLGQY